VEEETWIAQIGDEMEMTSVEPMALLALLFEGQVVYFDNALTTKTDVGNEYRKIVHMR